MEHKLAGATPRASRGEKLYTRKSEGRKGKEGTGEKKRKRKEKKRKEKKRKREKKKRKRKGKGREKKKGVLSTHTIRGVRFQFT